MQVNTIEMDPRIARIHYGDYMKRCRAHRVAREDARKVKAKELGKELRKVQMEKSRMELEDRELLKAYKALCRQGMRLIHIPSVIRDAGLTAKEKLPKLALCPADATRCEFSTQFGRYFRPLGTKVAYKQYQIELPWPAEITDTEWRKRNNYPLQARALVPTVPPHLRPDDLSQYWILWEAEWQPQAPVDPLLLSRVNTHTFAIVASWDLTPLEQRILEGRLTNV